MKSLFLKILIMPCLTLSVLAHSVCNKPQLYSDYHKAHRAYQDALAYKSKDVAVKKNTYEETKKAYEDCASKN